MGLYSLFKVWDLEEWAGDVDEEIDYFHKWMTQLHKRVNELEREVEYLKKKRYKI